MNQDVYNSIDMNIWNRKILKSYWLIVLLGFLAELSGNILIYFTEPEHFYIDLMYNTILPTISLLLIVLIAELINKYIQSVVGYIFIIVNSIIPSVLILSFPTHDGIQLILLVPILVSAYYFDKIKLILSCIMSILFFLILYGFNPTLNQEINRFELIATLALYIGCAVISLGIMNRGMFLIENLREAIQKKEQLLVESIVMDKASKEDALTNLYNHKSFHEYLDSLIEHSELTSLPIHLAIIDIDNFKKINDTSGHWVGDLILKRVSECLKETVPMDDFVARYGGEEFSVIFTEKSWEEAYQITERIRCNIHSIIHKELGGRPVSVSIGLQSYHKGDGKEEFFKRTDACLYTAKRTGKNKIVTQMMLSDHIS